MHAHFYMYYIFHKVCAHLKHMMVPTRSVFWDISEFCWPCSLVVLHRSAAYTCSLKRRRDFFSFCRWARSSSSFLKRVCHVHPNNLRHTSRQTRLHFHGIFQPVWMQTAAEMCDLTLPWHHRRCCCSQLCTGIALMCEGEQKVIWLETMGFLLEFQTEQRPDLIWTRIHECEWECKVWAKHLMEQRGG